MLVRRFFILLILVFVNDSLLAESLPSEFFDRNYVFTPPEIKIDKEVDSDKESTRIPVELEENSRKVREEPHFVEFEETKKQEVDSIQVEKRGEKVEYLGLIIDAVEKEDSIKASEVLAKLKTKTKVNIQKIYLIGDNYHVLREDDVFKKLLADKPLLFRRSSVPQYYAIDKSPTYIVGLGSGEILLEAVGNVYRYFNRYGEFVVPE